MRSISSPMRRCSAWRASTSACAAAIRLSFGLFCLARGQIGPSVAQRDLEVSWVQAYQRISSGNELVILDQHFSHLSAELAADPSDLSVDVCVIGMLVMPPD